MRTTADVYRDEMSRIVDYLFRTMLGTEVYVCFKACTVVPEPMTALVAFRGTWTGELALRSNTNQARRFAQLFIGETDGDLEEESLDVMGELANIIAGNLAQIMPRGAEHGIPLVLRGQRMAALELPIVARTSFELNDDVFSLELANVDGLSERA